MMNLRHIHVTIFFVVATLGVAAAGTSAGGEPRENWSVTDVTFLLFDKPYVERYGTATFQIRTRDDAQLVLIQGQIKPLTADDKAVDKLADKRKQVQASISEKSLAGAVIKGRVALSAAERKALTGKYRLFAMEQLVLTDGKGKEYRPFWCALPIPKLSLYGSAAALTGDSEAGSEPAGWGGSLKAEGVFVGVLEVGKTGSVSLFYSLSKGVKLDELKVSLDGEKPVAVKEAKKK